MTPEEKAAVLRWLAQQKQLQPLDAEVPAVYATGQPVPNIAPPYTLGDRIGNFSAGLGDGLGQSAVGTLNMLAHPIDSARALYGVARNALADPKGTAKAVGNSLAQDFRAVTSGNMLAAGETVGKYLSLRPKPRNVATKAAPVQFPMPEKTPRGAKLTMMSPQDYLRQVNEAQGIDFQAAPLPIRKPNTIRDLTKAIKAGEPIETPSLTMQKGKIVDQEGRHRAVAAIQAGVQQIPVFVFERK